MLSCVEPEPIYYTKSAYITTRRANKVSKTSILCGSDHIGVNGRTIIEPFAVLRGDLATIDIGTHCVIGSNTVIHPPAQRVKTGYVHITVSIGDYVTIERDCVIRAASIGSHSIIGSNSVIGTRCIISQCTMLKPNTIMPANTVTAPMGIYGGSQGKCCGRLDDTFMMICIENARQYFRLFQPEQTGTSNTTATNISTGTASPR